MNEETNMNVETLNKTIKDLYELKTIEIYNRKYIFQ